MNILGILKKDLYNGKGSACKGEKCIIKEVWLNKTINDVYCKIIIEETELEIITSIFDIESANLK